MIKYSEAKLKLLITSNEESARRAYKFMMTHLEKGPHDPWYLMYKGQYEKASGYVKHYSSLLKEATS